MKTVEESYCNVVKRCYLKTSTNEVHMHPIKVLFSQYGKQFWRTSPVLGDRKFAEVWARNKANQGHAFGFEFVKLEDEEKNSAAV